MASGITPIQNVLISPFANKGPEDTPGLLAKFFAALIGLLLVAGTIWAFFQLLLGAFGWISSGGDKGKLETAQQRILHAIIGLMIVFASWAIFLILLQFLGISPLGGGEINLKLPTLF